MRIFPCFEGEVIQNKIKKLGKSKIPSWQIGNLCYNISVRQEQNQIKGKTQSRNMRARSTFLIVDKSGVVYAERLDTRIYWYLQYRHSMN